MAKVKVTVTEKEFRQVWLMSSTEVADEFYPKVKPEGGNPGRGEFMAFQTILYVRIVDELRKLGVIRG
jgi:hypothetical protein